MPRPVGVGDHEDDVLQGVGSGPCAVSAGEVRPGVRHLHQRVDGRGVRRLLDVRLGCFREVDRGRRGCHDCLDVGCIVAVVAPHESVLADLRRRKELLASRAAHRTRHRRDDDVPHAQAVKGGDVRVTVALVGDLEAGIVDVERIGVLHDELAAAKDPRARPRLVAVLGLDLVEDDGQVLVGGVLALDEQREHLLVRGPEQVVRALAVLQSEQAVAVLGPAVRLLVRIARQQCREVHLLESCVVHLLAHEVLDVAIDEESERQPGEDSWRHATHVACADEQSVAGYFGVGGVVAERAQEESRHPDDHDVSLLAASELRRNR